jgi:hypothetical protein
MKNLGQIVQVNLNPFTFRGLHETRCVPGNVPEYFAAGTDSPNAPLGHKDGLLPLPITADARSRAGHESLAAKAKTAMIFPSSTKTEGASTSC